MAEAAWINADAGAPEYNAQELRRLQSMFLVPGTSDQFGARQGVRPTGQAVVSVSGTTWTQHDLSAVVYPGLTSASGPYIVEKSQESGGLDPADGSNDRIDALDLQVRDDDEDASGFRDVRVVYVPGTPAGTPVAPALTANSLRLATITVGSGGSPAPVVTTLAPWTVSSGGVLPVRDSSERPTTALHDGMTLLNVATGALEIRHGSAWPVAASVHGYQLRETLYFTAGGTFTKVNHPGLRAVRVRVQAGGGGGGGAASTTTGSAVAGGGGGGGYAEAWVPNSSLGANETVTVGVGGNGGAAGNNNGSAGGTSSLGAHVSASPGDGGAGSAQGLSQSTAAGGAGGIGTVGNLLLRGGDGGNGRGIDGRVAQDGYGGDSPVGGGIQRGSGTLFGGNGIAGSQYGGGGSGASSASSGAAASGGPGADGIVVVEVWV